MRSFCFVKNVTQVHDICQQREGLLIEITANIDKNEMGFSVCSK